jgi:hypothetical protein
MGGAVIGFGFWGLVFGAIIGLLARRKRRSGLAWGFGFGGAFFLLAFLGFAMILPEISATGHLGDTPASHVGAMLPGIALLQWIGGMVTLAFLPYLCSQCKRPVTKQQAKAGAGLCTACLGDNPAGSILPVR